MPIFGTGTTPANVERDKDVAVTPKTMKKRGQGNSWTRFWKKGRFSYNTALRRHTPARL